MVSCDDVRAELSNMADGDVPVSVRRELEHHLAECRTCEVLYDSTRKTIRIVTDVGAFELTGDVSRRLEEKIRLALLSKNE